MTRKKEESNNPLRQLVDGHGQLRELLIPSAKFHLNNVTDDECFFLPFSTHTHTHTVSLCFLLLSSPSTNTHTLKLSAEPSLCIYSVRVAILAKFKKKRENFHFIFFESPTDSLTSPVVLLSLLSIIVDISVQQ